MKTTLELCTAINLIPLNQTLKLIKVFRRRQGIETFPRNGEAWFNWQIYVASSVKTRSTWGWGWRNFRNSYFQVSERRAKATEKWKIENIIHSVYGRVFENRTHGKSAWRIKAFYKYILSSSSSSVLKLSSLTTKLRVVFDASVKSSSSLSLNDFLMCGPTVQDDLVSRDCREYFGDPNQMKFYKSIVSQLLPMAPNQHRLQPLTVL